MQEVLLSIGISVGTGGEGGEGPGLGRSAAADGPYHHHHQSVSTPQNYALKFAKNNSLANFVEAESNQIYHKW